LPLSRTALLAAPLSAVLMLAGAASAQADLVITSPADNAYTNNASPVVSFTGATPSADVELNVNGNVAGVGSAGGDGAGLLVPANPLTGVSQNESLSVDDENLQSDPSTIHFNTVPSMSGTSDGSALTADQVHFSASSGIPDEPIHLWVSDDPTDPASWRVAATETADDDGNFFDPIHPDGLTPGTWSAHLTSVDADGIESSASDDVSFDVLPAAPTFSGLFENARVNQNAVPVALSGIDPNASLVTLYEIGDDGPSQVAELDLHNTTTATMTANLPDGNHTLVVTQTVNGEETDPGSADPIFVTVQGTPPVLESIDTPNEDHRPYFEATNLLQNDAGNDTKVVLYVDGKEVGRDGDFGGGSDGLQPTNDLADGNHTAYVTTIDDLGHESAPSNTISFNVFTDAPPTDTPAAPVVPAPTPAAVAVPAPVTPAAPVIAGPTKVRLSAHTLTAKAPVKVGFTLATPGTVKVTITKTTKHGASKVVASTQVKVKKAGKGSITLKTKVGKTTLKKGTYTVSVQTVTASGASVATTQTLVVK
jgi:hypothetical protein